MKISKNNKSISQRRLSTLYFSLFSAWLLTVPFEGKILSMIFESKGLSNIEYGIISVILHFAGLFIAGFFENRYFNFKNSMIISISVCIIGSLFFYLPFSSLWHISLALISFFSGIFIATWGFQFKKTFPREIRMKAAADLLIYSNVIMVLLNLISVNLSSYIALFISILGLIASFIIILKLIECPSDEKHNGSGTKELKVIKSRFLNLFIPLCLFILVISINSGFMYSVINPTFTGYEFLTSYYWALPYILALLILRNIEGGFSRTYILYIGLAMIGISYIAFMWLKNSILNYLIINTLMLGAFGVYDLFFWTTLGKLLDHTDRPIGIFGIGLSMNVLGIFIGELLGNWSVLSEGQVYKISSIAVFIIFIVLMILPLINGLIFKTLNVDKSLEKNKSMEEGKHHIGLDLKNKTKLTDREKDIVDLLLKGYTYKGVAESLYISENTVKYHIKNIYQKFEVKSKMELIKLFKDDGI